MEQPEPRPMRPPPPPPRIRVATVAENRPPWQGEPEVLFSSLRRFGGAVSEASCVAYFVSSVDPDVATRLARLGVEVEVVDPLGDGYRVANKLRMFEDSDGEFDWLVAVDTDVAVCDDFSAVLDGTAVLARPADRARLSFAEWEQIFEHFGLAVPAARYASVAGLEETLPYFNSGVVLTPAPLLPILRERWGNYLFALLEARPHLPAIRGHSYFADQIALTLTLAGTPLPYRALPVEMNFPTCFRVHPIFRPQRIRPYVLHHHHRLSQARELLPCRYRCADESIQHVNRHLRHDLDGR